MLPSDNRLLERVVELLETNDWIFAKTMPHNPHHYTLRKNWTNDKSFVGVVNYIRQHGYVAIYNNREYTQFDANGYFYWTMGAPISETILINRKPRIYESPYDKIARQYDNLFQDENSLQENIDVMQMIGDVSGLSVLDIGCGTGLFLDYAQPTCYTGIDLSSGMLNEFVAKHPAHRDTIVNSTFMSFANGRRYDLIMALFGSASYLTPQELNRIPTLLTPGGRVFLMFYTPGYEPVTYQQTGIRANPVSTAETLGCNATTYHAFSIVQGTTWAS